jgi:hypothetical protein
VMEVALHEHRKAAVGGPAAFPARDGELDEVTAARRTRCPQGSSGHLSVSTQTTADPVRDIANRLM